MVITESQAIPFDMSKDTLKSIRIWIDKISELSIGIIHTQRIDPNEMIITKHKMIKQLIVLSTPLIDENDLNEIETFFSKIKFKTGKIKIPSGWNHNHPIYTNSVDNLLDECVQGIEKALKKYFVPSIDKGERY